MGVALPREAISSEAIDVLIGRPAGWTEANFSIGSRYWARDGETSSALGALAAENALLDAGWDASDLDVIIGACGVMEQPIPGTSVLIQKRLGIGDSGIPAFDVNSTCLSFLSALQVALHGFAAGGWKKVLIVAADIASAALDFKTPETSVIFGDGAVAIALEAGGPHRVLAMQFASYGTGAELCKLEAGGTRLRPHEDLDGFLAKSRFQMDGAGLFKVTARHFPDFLGALFGRAGVEEKDVGVVVPHQASAAALEHLKRSMPSCHDRTVDIFRRFGNQIAASLPHALFHARQDGLLRPGVLSLLVGSSAGISLGGAVVEW